jgi:hypothetical protein
VTLLYNNTNIIMSGNVSMMTSKDRSDSSLPDENEDMNIDFTDPSFILQNISYKGNFEVHSNFSLPARNNMIECMSDQICFYIMCAFRAHHLAASSSGLSFEEKLKIKPPHVLVYGSGVVAESAMDALKAVGVAPYIKVFSRDVSTAKQWAKKGYRSTVEMTDGYQIDILLICSNLSSFSQLCRDLSQFLTAKTFIISNVFCLQRKRMYNLFGTPGIVRTYVERKGASKPPNSRNISTRAYSARQLASRANGVKNLILILENYMIALDIHKDTARREAIHLVVGSDRVSLEETRMSSPYKSMRHISYSDEEEDSFSSGENSDSDSDTDSTATSVNSFANLAKEVANEVSKEIRRQNSNDFETRKALFQRRQRSFQSEEEAEEGYTNMSEAEKRFERKLKRKQQRVQKKMQRSKQERETRREMRDQNLLKQRNCMNGEDIDIESEELVDAMLSSSQPLAVECGENDSVDDSERSIARNDDRQVSPISTSPLVSPARPPKARPHSSPTVSMSENRNVNCGESSPAPRIKKSIDANWKNKVSREDDSSRRANVMVAFSPTVKIKKKAGTPKSVENSSTPPGSPYTNSLRKSKSVPTVGKREKELRDEQEKMDKILGIESSSKKSSGYLHEVAVALTVNPNIDSIVKKSPLLVIICNIEKRYGVIFREELSKHILIMDLPSLSHVRQKSPSRRRKSSLVGSVLAQRAALARKKMLLSVMPTVAKKQVGYLEPDALLAIFNSDRKTSELVDKKNPLLEQMNDDSDGEDKEGAGDDLFFDDAPREKFRCFILGDRSLGESNDMKERDDDSGCSVSIMNFSSTEGL